MLEGLLRCGSNADLVEFGWCAGERTDTTWKIERRKSGVSEEALNSWHVCETQDLEPGDGPYCKTPPPRSRDAYPKFIPGTDLSMRSTKCATYPEGLD